MKVRKAQLRDLESLIEFTSEEAREAEGSVKIPETLEKGIKAALVDNSIATYRVLVDGQHKPVGSVSAVKEWIDGTGSVWCNM